jgi:hypothetical protein
LDHQRTLSFKQESTMTRSKCGYLIKSPRPSNPYSTETFLLMLEVEMLTLIRLIPDGTNSSSMKMKD